MAATAVSQVLALAVARGWAGSGSELHCSLKIHLTSDTFQKSVAVLLVV